MDDADDGLGEDRIVRKHRCKHLVCLICRVTMLEVRATTRAVEV